MSWIFVSYTYCCITPRISKFKAHDDPGPLCGNYDTSDAIIFVISRCYTFSVFLLSQGSVATLIGRGGWSSYRHMCRSFLNLTVKTALKSVDFWKSLYRPKLVGFFFMAHGVYFVLYNCRYQDRWKSEEYITTQKTYRTYSYAKARYKS